MGGTTGDTDGGTGGGAVALATLCAEAERAGAGALWAVDHLFWPGPMLECLTALTVAVTATRTARVGSCVLQLPLRSPAAVAKQAATLQLLSGGRFVLGIGVGSHRGEYEAAGADFARRGRLIDEGMACLHRAWATAGTDAGYRQEPAAPPVPLWVGGTSDAARHRAARAGDGWVPLFLSPSEYAAELDRLRSDAAAAGRAPGAITAAVVVLVHVAPDAATARTRGTRWLSSLYGIPAPAFERHLIAGPAGACAEGVARYLAAGAEHVVVMVADDQAVDHFAALAEALDARAGGAPPASGRPDLLEVGA